MKNGPVGAIRQGRSVFRSAFYCRTKSTTVPQKIRVPAWLGAVRLQYGCCYQVKVPSDWAFAAAAIATVIPATRATIVRVRIARRSGSDGSGARCAVCRLPGLVGRGAAEV